MRAGITMGRPAQLDLGTGPLILLGLAAAVILWHAVKALSRVLVRRSLLRKTRLVAERQMKSLLRRRVQLVQNDPYGKPVRDKWEKEISYFIAHHVAPCLTTGQRRAMNRNIDAVRCMIDARVEDRLVREPPYAAFCDDMTAAEFEAFCAEALRRSGWNARVTRQSRDQGVDVIAEKRDIRVVVQCKLYARPVGNKSVQEAAAARAHEQADFGVVVSNNRYTQAAEQLAATNGVLLLHHRDLRDLEDIIGQRRG